MWVLLLVARSQARISCPAGREPGLQPPAGAWALLPGPGWGQQHEGRELGGGQECVPLFPDGMQLTPPGVPPEPGLHLSQSISNHSSPIILGYRTISAPLAPP